MNLPKGVELAAVSATFTQEGDCCDSGSMGQTLHVETHNGGIEPDHSFLVLKTDRWAIENADEFAAMLKGVLELVTQQKGGA